MTAVQWTLRSVHGDIYVRIATYTKDHLLTTGLVDWSVTDDPRIALQKLLIQPEYFPQVGRTCLFFTVKEKLEVGCGFCARGELRIKRSQNRHHTGFVIRGRTSVEAPLRIDGLICIEHRQKFSARFQRCTSQHRLPGQGPAPLVRICRLTIVVCIEDKRATDARCFPLAINCRRRG